MSSPNGYYPATPRNFAGTSNNNGMMESALEASSSSLEMSYENSLSSRSALPRQYVRYSLPVIPTTATSFPHSFLPSPFVPHYLSPPPMYYYQSASTTAYHDSILHANARYYPRSSSDSSPQPSSGELKIHDSKWYPPGTVQYHPPMPYYPPFGSITHPTTPTSEHHLQPYLPQCYLDPYASHFAYSQGSIPISQPPFRGSELPRSKVTEVFRPASTSTPKYIEDRLSPGDSRLPSCSQGTENESQTLENSRSTAPGNPILDSSLDVDCDGRKHRRGKRKASEDSSTPRKRKESEGKEDGVRRSNVAEHPDVATAEGSTYYKAELSSATTIVLRRSPQHNSSCEAFPQEKKRMLRTARRTMVFPAKENSNINSRNVTVPMKPKLFPMGVKPKRKRGRPRKYPLPPPDPNESVTVKCRRFLDLRNKSPNASLEEPLDLEAEEPVDPEDPLRIEPREECLNNLKPGLTKGTLRGQPCTIFLERIPANFESSQEDNINMSKSEVNSPEKSSSSVRLKSQGGSEASEDGMNVYCNESIDRKPVPSPKKSTEEPEVCKTSTEEAGVTVDAKVEDERRSQDDEDVHAIDEEPAEELKESTAAKNMTEAGPKNVSQNKGDKSRSSAQASTSKELITSSESKIEVIDLEVPEKTESEKAETSAAINFRKGRHAEKKEGLEPRRNIVFSTSSERALLRIPEKTLRLRVRGIDPVLNRKFKLKRDGPLFPKVPITYAEKKLEKIAISRMQTWLLNKEQGETYLHRAAKENDPEVVLYCLKFDGFHPRCTNNRGYTPLHEACKVGGVQVAKILLDHGAYHSQPAKGNIRPIHIASQIGHLELVQLLLSLGANPFLLTIGGTNCFDLAESHQNVIKYLTEYFSLLPTLPHASEGDSSGSSPSEDPSVSACPKIANP